MHFLSEHLHPMAVHFPIALFISAFLLNTLGLILKNESLQRTALYIYVLAALFAPLTVQTGLWEQQEFNLQHPILGLHKIFAFLTLWSSWLSLPILWLSQRLGPKNFKTAFMILSFLLAVFVSLTGYFGGKMVYEYGIGVEM